MVQLDAYGSRMPTQLSGGQQQRVALARALVFEPPVLLMDEPLGALDKKLREQLQIEIKTLQQGLGVTVIYVIHDQEEALTMSDRIAVMSDGQIAQIGSPASLYGEPASPFVADFIGKMNFLPVEYVGSVKLGHQIRVTEASTLNVTRPLNGHALEVSPGLSLQAAIRPENISLAARGLGGPNAIAGTVNTSIYLGTHQILLVDIDGRTAPLCISRRRQTGTYRHSRAAMRSTSCSRPMPFICFQARATADEQSACFSHQSRPRATFWAAPLSHRNRR